MRGTHGHHGGRPRVRPHGHGRRGTAGLLADGVIIRRIVYIAGYATFVVLRRRLRRHRPRHFVR